MLHTKFCFWCQQKFTGDTKEEKRGNSKYCSTTCFHKHYSQIRRSRPKPNNVRCAACLVSFRAIQSRIKRSIEKHDRVILFCSHRCHSVGQQLNSSIPEVRPIHYGSGTGDYRIVIFAIHPYVCMKCGYDKNKAAIIVHHKDRDRTNNAVL